MHPESKQAVEERMMPSSIAKVISALFLVSPIVWRKAYGSNTSHASFDRRRMDFKAIRRPLQNPLKTPQHRLLDRSRALPLLIAL